MRRNQRKAKTVKSLERLLEAEEFIKRGVNASEEYCRISKQKISEEHKQSYRSKCKSGRSRRSNVGGAISGVIYAKEELQSIRGVNRGAISDQRRVESQGS